MRDLEKANFLILGSGMPFVLMVFYTIYVQLMYQGLHIEQTVLWWFVNQQWTMAVMAGLMISLCFGIFYFFRGVFRNS